MPRGPKEIFGVTVDGDITGLKRAMNEAVSVFRSTERSLKNVEKALEVDPYNSDLLTKRAQIYKKEIAEAEQSVKKLKGLLREIEKNPNFTEDVGLREKYTSLLLQITQVDNKLKEVKKRYKEIADESKRAFDVKVDKFFKGMKDSEAVLKRIKDSLANVDKAIDLDPNNIDNYVRKQELLAEQIRVTEYALRNYKKRLDEIKSDPNYLQGFHPLQKEFTETSAKAEELEQDLVRLKKEASESPQVARFQKQFEILGQTFNEIATATSRMSRALQGVLAGAFESFKSYESSIANIRRVVSDLSDDTIQDLKDMAVETGTAFESISDYATIAGALGLAEKDIAKFARTMVDLNVASGGAFSGEEGAKGIAVFLKQLNLGIDQAENFGSAIAVIGDKYADIGDETVRVATKLTGLNAIVKTNQYELIGLAGVMADLGLASDTNANGINRAFLQIDKVIGGGVKNAEVKLNSLARTSGMTADEFRQAWGNNAVDTFLRFTDGLKSSVFNDINKAIATSDEEVLKFADSLGWSAEQFKRAWGEDSQAVFNAYVESLENLDSENEVAAKVLSDLGIASVNTAQTMLRLSGSGNEVRKAIELTSQAWNENTALTRKSNIIYDTTERKLNGLFESIKQLGGALIDEFAIPIKEGVDRLTELTRQANSLSPTMKKLITYFIGFGASISPVSRALGFMYTWFGKNDNGASKFTKTMQILGSTLNSPVGLIAGFTALIGLAHAMGTEWENNNVFRKMSRDMNELSNSFAEISQIADNQYLASLESIDEVSERHFNWLEKLVEKYNDEKTSYQERGELLGKIQERIDELNSSLGEEVFYWDSASGAVKSHKDDIDSVKQAYQDYILEIKKQNWLEAHADQYQQAINDYKSVEDDLLNATKGFYEEVKGIPQTYLDMFTEAAQGTDSVSEAMDKFLEKLPEGALTEEQIQNLRNAYGEWSNTVDNASAVLDTLKQTISDYESIESASQEEFDEITSRLETSTGNIKDYTAYLIEKSPELVNARDLIATKVGEEDSALGEILGKLDEEAIKQETLKGIQERRTELVVNQKDRTAELVDMEQNVIDTWEGWTPSVKTAVINIVTNGGSGFGYGGGGGGNNSYSVDRSGGFGNLYNDMMSSLRNTFSNFKSGGYYNGGLTVNANFTINNANNLNNKQMATIFVDDFVDKLNNALGMEI